MDKILVIFTGGTIGSKAENHVIDVDEGVGYQLITAFHNTVNVNISFDTIQPMNILSENLVPSYWETLNNALAKQDLKKYKGVIITHGSDTLPYTTAVFSYLLKNIAMPVVFVASNRSIGRPNSNGVENFIAAVQFILEAKLPGVFAVFKNNMDKMVVYLGTRILEADRSDDQYRSYQGIDFGEIKNGTFIYNHEPTNAPLPALKSSAQLTSVDSISITKKIACIFPYPGLDYTNFNFDAKRPAAILHGLYHSSTACIEPKENSLVEFSKNCKNSGIDLYLCDCRHCMEGNMYLTSKELMQTGIYPLTNISYEAALAKLYVAYNQSSVSPSEYMRQNIYYEYVG